MQSKLTANFINYYFLLVVLCLGLISCNINSSQNEVYTNSKEGIQFFNGTLDSAITIAKKEKKPIFIMIHANWCSVCTKMKKNILPKKEVGDIYNSHFVNVLINYDSTDGKALRDQFQVKGTPSFLYLSPDGQILNRTSGYQEAEELLEAAKNLKMEGKAVCN